MTPFALRLSRHFREIFQLRAGVLLCCCILLPVVISGCASRASTDTIRSGIRADRLDELKIELEETHQSFGEFVTALNLARVYQVDGRWSDSIEAFEEALVLLEDYENRAAINMREILAGAGTIFFSRGAGEYFGVGYERSLLHTFNALNYLMLGDFSGAAVEIRRMDKRQELWLEESQARIEKHLEPARLVDSPDSLPQGYSMRELLRDQEVRDLINNYQDPFSYSLAAILFRLAEDPQASDVSMRRAIELSDNANALFSRVWTAPPPTKKDGEIALSPVVPPLPPIFPAEAPEEALPQNESVPGSQELTVIAFSGLAPALRVENIRVWLPPIGYILVDMPAYAAPVRGEAPAIAVYSGREPVDIALYPLLRTDILAYRTLWDEVRMETALSISRAMTRAGISTTAYVAARSHRDTEGFAPLIASLTTVIMDLFASSMSGTVRNWETLPNAGYLAVETVPRGSTVDIRVANGSTSIDLPPDARGVIIMVTELSNSNMKVRYATY